LINPEASNFHIIDVDTSDIPQYQDENWHKTMKESLGERIYKIEICLDLMLSIVLNSFIVQKKAPMAPFFVCIQKSDW
jgi:hypothetical protein